MPESFLEPITEKTLLTLKRTLIRCPRVTHKEIRRLAQQDVFLHWYLAFPDVFQPRKTIADDPIGSTSGFDVVSGHPPWKHRSRSRRTTLR